MADVRDLVTKLVLSYRRTNERLVDPIRGGVRVEIPSAFLLAICKYDLLKEQKDLAKELADLLVANQQASGAWLEFPYHEREEKVGFEGAIPTCFATLALLEAHRALTVAAKSNNVTGTPYLDAAKRATEYLCRHEKGGYFVKASFNKSDVVNTNLFASLAIRTFATTLPDYAKLGETIGFAVNRALLRALASQNPNGSFPYISYGTQVSYLYHAMATALLGLHLKHVPYGVVRVGFRRGLSYLKRIMDTSGRFRWERASLRDKEGAVWAYGWAAVCFALADDIHHLNQTITQLGSYRDNEFLRNGDFDEREDIFYTAWTMEALSLMESQPLASRPSPPGAWLGAQWLFFKSLWPRALYLLKVLKRKYFRGPLDSGPAEEN